MLVEVPDAEGQRVLPGLLLGGRYLLVRPLAGEARWVARHGTLQIEVAVELMNGELAKDPAARRRFDQEVRLLAGLRSAHVVTVHDYGDGELPYLVTELLQGEDLAARLARDKRLPLDAVTRLLTQVAKGLSRAHEAGLTHLALDPTCIFLAQVDGGEVAKIVGFGVARGVRRAGARSFLSPEQLRGARAVDLRADLWSLAAILYRALTGVLPFPAEDPDARAAQVLGEPVLPPSETAPDLPRALDDFFARALARDPDARFASARELCAAFEAAAAGAARAPRAAVSAVEVARMELARQRAEPRKASLPRKQPLAVTTQRRIAAALGVLVGAAITFVIGYVLRGRR